MNKRIKKKKLFTNQIRNHVIIYGASVNLADKYEDMVRVSYLPYDTIPKSTRLRLNKRLCHQIMCRYSKYFTIVLLSSSLIPVSIMTDVGIPVWDIRYKDNVRWVFNVEGG